SEELRRFNQELPARRQEKLGRAVLAAFRRSPESGPAFLAAFQREMNRVRISEERVARRLESRVRSLTAQEAGFQKAIPLIYQEATTSAHRSARLFDESYREWTRRILTELNADLSWRRKPEDYAQLVGVVHEILTGFRGVGGFVEYGLPALAGLITAMTWLGVTINKDPLKPWVLESEIGQTTWLPYYNQSRNEVNVMTQPMTVFSWPKEAVFGSNASAEVGAYAARNHIRRAVILMDEGVRQHDLAAPLMNSLAEAGIEFRVYDQVKPQVPDAAVADVFGRFRHEQIHLIIAVGGGSTLDTAKAVGILLSNGGEIQDYEGVDKVPKPIPCLYAVPTMAGSGSEVSQFCVVQDTRTRKAIEIFSRRIIPEAVFIDPLLTLSMPPELTARCGMDALSNCIEAYFSSWANPLTDAKALHGIRLISESLRTAVADGRNIGARQQMAIAAFEAGLAFTNAHSGAVHAMGHPIAGLFGVPQGVSDAILLPHVMRYNLNVNMDRMVNVAAALGESIGDLSKPEAAEKAIGAVERLIVEIGLPTTLDKVGVEREAISKLSQLAMQDAFMETHPSHPSMRDVEEIYESAFVDYSRPPAPTHAPESTAIH
ncbi:MAG: iron-containing alcohol dehydrogenase, partial [Nitrospirae bacterium]|nr:iron-containing alcohol dehydrogenase [Nitrospirota bacterium]